MNHKKNLFIVVFIGVMLTTAISQTSPEHKILFEKAKFTMETKGDLNGAITLFNDIIKKYPKEREYAAKSQLYIGLCYEKLGVKEAQLAYRKVVDKYPDQTEMVALAKAKLAVLGTGPTVKSTEMAMRRIWVSGKNQIVGISADGRYVVYNLNETGDLWLHDLQSGEERQITHEASKTKRWFAAGQVAISPDNKQIAYTWNIGNRAEFRLSGLDGSSMRVLHDGQDGRRIYANVWMPDGRSIRAVSVNVKEMTFQKQIISLEDNTIRNFGPADREYLMEGPISPDGRQIANSRQGDIFIYDIATDKESIFIQNPATDAVVGWTPDGSGIVFVSNRSGTHDLYLQGIENGKSRGDLELLVKDFGPNTGFGLLRNGRLYRIDFADIYDSFIVPVDKQTGKPTGTPSLVDSDLSGTKLSPMWSSDGKLLYYRKNSKVLVIRSEATGEKREVTLKSNLMWFDRPVLSPEGSQFVVTMTDGYVYYDVFTIDSESGEVRQITKIPVPTEYGLVYPCPNWSPDGKAIYYKVRSPEKSGEFIINCKDLLTGEEKVIYRGAQPGEMKLSPDGTRFVFYRSDGQTKSYELDILDIQSGKKLVLWQVTEADAPGGISEPQWTPDGKYILVKKNLSQETELWRFPATGGPGEKIYFSPEKSMDFALHPDGNRMAFTQYRINIELWVLENFLPK